MLFAGFLQEKEWSCFAQPSFLCPDDESLLSLETWCGENQTVLSVHDFEEGRLCGTSPFANVCNANCLPLFFTNVFRPVLLLFTDVMFYLRGPSNALGLSIVCPRLKIERSEKDFFAGEARKRGSRARSMDNRRDLVVTPERTEDVTLLEEKEKSTLFVSQTDLKFQNSAFARFEPLRDSRDFSIPISSFESLDVRDRILRVTSCRLHAFFRGAYGLKAGV